MTQHLRYNVTGQVLRHTPATRQATAAWVLEDMLLSAGAAAKALDSGNVSVDAATESTIAIAGPTTANPRLIDVASTAGFVVGTVYEIVNADNGEREQFTLSGLDSNDSLITRHPLFSTYPSGSTVQGLELVTAAIAVGVVQDEIRMQTSEPLRIVWTYADGHHHQELVRLVRYDHGDADLSKVRADVLELFPDAATRMEHHGRDTLPGHIRLAERQLRAQLLDRKIHVEELLVGEQGHLALVWRVLWHLARLGNAPGGDERIDPREWAAYCKGEYDKFWGALTSGEGGGEVLKIEPINDTSPSTTDVTYQRTFGEL